MNTSLLALEVAFGPSIASANDCEVVRCARALLVQRGLDDSSLCAIEPAVCAPVATPVIVQPQPHPHAQPSPACSDYRTMLAVADVDPSRMQAQHRALIEQMASGACRGCSAPREAWPNGIIARDTDTTLRWPTGITTRDARGEWYAPSGLRTAPALLLAEACRVSADPRFCGRA